MDSSDDENSFFVSTGKNRKRKLKREENEPKRIPGNQELISSGAIKVVEPRPLKVISPCVSVKTVVGPNARPVQLVSLKTVKSPQVVLQGEPKRKFEGASPIKLSDRISPSKGPAKPIVLGDLNDYQVPAAGMGDAKTKPSFQFVAQGKGRSGKKSVLSEPIEAASFLSPMTPWQSWLQAVLTKSIETNNQALLEALVSEMTILMNMFKAITQKSCIVTQHLTMRSDKGLELDDYPLVRSFLDVESLQKIYTKAGLFFGFFSYKT